MASRRRFLKSAAVALAAASAPGRLSAAFDPLEKTIRELQDAMRRKDITSAELVRFYLDRIATYDAQTNAVLFVNPHALDDARALDAERSRGKTRGPLHGIPILLKDNFDTKDMPTTGGALALQGVVPKEDAFQVKKLRDAGAVLLGKVNLHELALGLTTVSSLGGQTHDPYDLTRAPGGSSGGSAVAATMNFAAATLGTDTSGSIRIPSSHNNVVGLRPSLGLSSRAGIIPFGHTQDTGGPIARTVEDVAILLDATVGDDPADPSTAASRGRIPRTYTTSLRRDALKSARIGVVWELFRASASRGASPDADDEVAAVVQRGLEEMKQHGATLVDVTIPDLAAQLQSSNLLTQELKFYLGDYLKRSAARVGSVEELLASGLHSAQLEGILNIANGTANNYLTSDDYKSRLAAREGLAGRVAGTMAGLRVDALAYPVVRRIAPAIPGNQIGSNAGLSAQTGLPAINVPAGFTAGGFPVGIELLGREFAEPTLIAIAYAFEQTTRHRRAPRLPVLRDNDNVSSIPAGLTTFEVTASGAHVVPPSEVGFTATARFTFSNPSRELRYELTIPSASLDQIAGVYLHRRTTRPNGGVLAILAKRPMARQSGVVVLSEQEAADLKTGKLYLAVASRKSPRLSARADLTP
jgi:amidase